MVITQQEYKVKDLSYTIRSAREEDGKILSRLRLQIDGETEYLDREPGEAFLDEEAFKKLIRDDTKSNKNLFLVAVASQRIVGFSRCEGNSLKRLSHKVEFGIGILKEYWSYGIGYNLLNASVLWADSENIKKITLYVLETNEKAIGLYKKLGFEEEGVLKADKLLSDGNYYNTVVMGRVKEL